LEEQVASFKEQMSDLQDAYEKATAANQEQEKAITDLEHQLTARKQETAAVKTLFLPLLKLVTLDGGSRGQTQERH